MVTLVALVITGKAGSPVKVSSRVVVETNAPSVTVRVTEKLPATVSVPVISPVIGSRVKPAGNPVAVIDAVGEAPVVKTWYSKKLPTRPVALVLLMMLIPEGGGG
jgi:hypothetical protein